MRRSLAWIIILVMMLSLCACTDQVGKEISEEITQESTEASIEASSETSGEAVASTATETETTETGTIEPPTVVSEGPQDVFVLFTSDVH
ncbi:MAG: hypothetical protein IJL09_05700, partial [Lachnospiraceae bacterium]|nr:hypothetical protein [Lachnospiraceae bacterium]